MSSFRFKQFSVCHSRSSMPVGMDAIMLGAWVNPLKKGRVLDIGTGCGVLSLICAQRMPGVEIVGIDIDEESVIEACKNFRISSWNKRLRAELKDFSSMVTSEKWNLIISNPPFFNSGVTNFDSARKLAHHDSTLSPVSLIGFASRTLTSDGVVAMILPTERTENIIKEVEKFDLELLRSCRIYPRPDLRSKRIMLEIGRKKEKSNARNIREENLVIENRQGEYSEEFKELTREFYLNF